MPRPPIRKRRFSQQSPGKSNRAPSNAGLSSTPRVKLQEKLLNKVIGQRPQDSDDSDKLVTRTRSGRRAPEQIFASGGVAKGDKPGVFPTKQQRSQRLRSETEEVIRRSRSKSVEALRQNASKSRSASVVGSKENGASEPAPNVSASATKSPQPLLSKSHPTPAGERSVLGTLKPRRRQPSILQMIDNNDSSIINPEDEEQFLPDDESTPIHVRSSEQQQVDAQSNSTTPKTVSRKRKLGMEEPVRATPDLLPVSADAQPEPSLPTQDTVILDSQRPQTAQTDDDDIMALPQSSSAESSPQKPKAAPPHKHKRVPSVPTTEQLQSLMPSKRRKGARQRKEAAEFDIPEDSDAAEANGIEDESIFQPRKRGGKSRKGKDVTVTKMTTKATNKSRQAPGPSTPAVTKTKAKPNTKSTSTPLKSTLNTPRTPLPLTRNLNQENKTTSLARNRDQNSKPSGNDNTVTNQNSKEKQFGGFHLPATARSTRRGLRSAPTANITTGGESDKENSTAAGRITRSSRKRTFQPDPDTIMEDARPSIEVRESIDNEATEPSADPRGEDILVRESVVTDTDVIPASADAKAWKSKWAGIDDWNLDYEEVEISTGSSSPLLKASVV